MNSNNVIHLSTRPVPRLADASPCVPGRENVIETLELLIERLRSGALDYSQVLVLLLDQRPGFFTVRPFHDGTMSTTLECMVMEEAIWANRAERNLERVTS